jgi:PAS domain S-box-containing protein
MEMVASEGRARPGTGELACATSVERSGDEIPAREGTGSANTGASLESEAHVVALWQAIASAADHAETLEEASQECLDAVCHLTGWPVGHLYLVRNDDLVSTSVWHLQEPERFAALRRATAATRLTIGRGLPSEVLATRQPVWIDDLSLHPNFPRARVAGELGVRSAFAFPVILGSQVVAVLEFFSPAHVALDQALLDLVARVGSQLSRVAERRRAAVRLASSDERLRRILETANESFISMDSGGSVTEWNQCAESTFGWARHEVLGRSLAELLVPARHREAHRRGVERFVATGQGKVVGTTIELTALHRRGHEIPIELAIWAFDEGGEWSFNALIRDISARKDAEARLRASERRLAEAQQVAGVGSWEWDLATNDVAWSDELYRIYGVAPEVTQASHAAFLDLVDVRDRPRVVETLSAAMTSGTPFDMDLRVNRPDGCLRVIHARGEVLWEKGQACACEARPAT